jgi:phosphate transport system permease protein
MAAGAGAVFTATSAGRRRKERLFVALAVVALVLALVPLVAIFGYIFANGIRSVLSVDFFLQDPPSDLSAGGGGVRNALLGTIEMTGIASLIAVPVGLGVAIFAVEVGGRLARAARFLIDVLAGLPSIVVGIFVYTTVVVTQGHFSGLAGSLALAIVMLPVITVSAEEMLRLTPRTIAEGARALGMARWRAVLSVFIPISLSGIVTGVLLGISRAIGETAPLIFTSLGNNFLTLELDQPMQALPLLIYRNALNSAYAAARDRAFGAALLLIAIVFGLNLAGRWLTARRRLAGSPR